ncbi:hypothetical protein [Vibrio nereis]|uniref:hypothetical protein n=1 Tax=Vibrio nereis TaxID=693 RepID=UPI0024955937|nr:hypothetical protein [Vibrio nereis]
MRTVQLFDLGDLGVGTESLNRTVRTNKNLYQLVKQGKKGLAPVAVWADAALATIDCLSAFLRYQQAKEITKQLQWQKRSLEKQLENFEKEHNLRQEWRQQEQELRLATLDKLFREDNQAAELWLAKINSHRKSIDELFTTVKEIRKQAPSDTPELKTLILTIDNLMSRQLKCLVESFDG